MTLMRSTSRAPPSRPAPAATTTSTRGPNFDSPHHELWLREQAGEAGPGNNHKYSPRTGIELDGVIGGVVIHIPMD